MKLEAICLVIMMSAKNNDKQGRFRSKIVSFRVSPEEANIIDRKARLSGKTKQDYIIEALHNHEVVMQPNTYILRSLYDELRYFIDLFEQLDNKVNLPCDELEVLEMMLKIIIQLKEKDTNQKDPHANENS